MLVLMSSIVALPIQFSFAEVESEDNVKVCHDGIILEIVASDLDAHLAHGDTKGECEERTNSAPVLRPIGYNSEDENTSAELTIFAKDPDPHDVLTFTTSVLPGFVSLEDRGKGKASLVFKTSCGDAGMYEITITVTDNGTPNLSDEETFTLEITEDCGEEPVEVVEEPVEVVEEPVEVVEEPIEVVEEPVEVGQYLECKGDPTNLGWTYYQIVVSGQITKGPSAEANTDTISPDGTIMDGHLLPNYSDDFFFTGTIVSITADQSVICFVDGVEVIEEPELTLYVQKTEVSEELEFIFSDSLNIQNGEELDKDTIEQLNKAVKHLDKSLNPELWLSGDGNRLNPENTKEHDAETGEKIKKGDKVFKQSARAVKDLMKIDDDQISDIIEEIVRIDRELALVAIQEAEDLLMNIEDKNTIDKMNTELGKAIMDLERAEMDLANDKPDKAIKDFKKAWKHAQHAIKNEQKFLEK